MQLAINTNMVFPNPLNYYYKVFGAIEQHFSPFLRGFHTFTRNGKRPIFKMKNQPSYDN